MAKKSVEIIKVVEAGEEYSLAFTEPLTTDRIEEVDETISATYVTSLPQRAVKPPKVAAEKLAILKIPGYLSPPKTFNGMPFPSHYNDEHLIAIPFADAEEYISSMQPVLDAALE